MSHTPRHRAVRPKSVALQPRRIGAVLAAAATLTALAAAGLITRKRRSGSFVAAPRTEETVLAIHDIEAEITGSGRAYAYELLERIERGAGAQDAERLAVREDRRDHVAPERRGGNHHSSVLGPPQVTAVSAGRPCGSPRRPWRSR